MTGDFSMTEPVVRASSPMPAGYSFVPKGDPYCTRNCRQQTRQAHQVVYVVVDDKKKQVGIRVPRSVHALVSQLERETRSARRQKVMKSDQSLEKHFRDAVLAQFPRIPPEELAIIIRHATAKRKGRVGRATTVIMTKKVHLAVQAHIRHTKTNYEDLLKNGTDRESARALTVQNALDILKSWEAMPTAKTKTKAPKSAKKSGNKIAPLKGTVSSDAVMESARQGEQSVRTRSTRATSDESQKTENAITRSLDSAVQGSTVNLPTTSPRSTAGRRRKLGKRQRRTQRLAGKAETRSTNQDSAVQAAPTIVSEKS